MNECTKKILTTQISRIDNRIKDLEKVEKQGYTYSVTFVVGNLSQLRTETKELISILKQELGE